MPGVTYERSVQFTPHGPGRDPRRPRPAAGRPLPPAGPCSRTSRSCCARRSPRWRSASRRRRRSVGVNGDYFSPSDGRPSGIFLRDGVLATPPNPAPLERRASRSTACSTCAGSASAAPGAAPASAARSTPQQGAGHERHRALHPAWGPATPAHRGRVRGRARLVPAGDSEHRPRRARDRRRRPAATGGSRRDARCSSRAGTRRAKLQAEAQPGTVVTLRLILQPDWSVVSDAIGGGPVLVRDGAPVFRVERGLHHRRSSLRAGRARRSASARTGGSCCVDDRRAAARLLASA